MTYPLILVLSHSLGLVMQVMIRKVRVQFKNLSLQRNNDNAETEEKVRPSSIELLVFDFLLITKRRTGGSYADQLQFKDPA